MRINARSALTPHRGNSCAAFSRARPGFSPHALRLPARLLLPATSRSRPCTRRRAETITKAARSVETTKAGCCYDSIRFVEMEAGGFWTGMLTAGDDHVAGLEDLTFPMTQGMEETHGDLPVEVEELDVQVQPTPSVQRRGKTKGSAKRTKNFDPLEDLLVCSAWLNVSKDPINGANQSRGTFWSGVHAYFEKHKKTPYVRSESSLLHRWSTIQLQVNKYCACYEQIEGRNQSGKTIRDTISDALELSKELDKEKKKFTLVPCWNKLKGEDKWKAKQEELAEQEKLAANKKQKVNIDSTPRTVEATNNENVLETAAPESEARKRTQGVKKAKEALKRGGGEACMEALDKMWAKKEAFDLKREMKKEERFLISLELEKKRMDIEEKRAESDLIKEEKEIMAVDMTSLSATVLCDNAAEDHRSAFGELNLVQLI